MNVPAGQSEFAVPDLDVTGPNYFVITDVNSAGESGYSNQVYCDPNWKNDIKAVTTVKVWMDASQQQADIATYNPFPEARPVLATLYDEMGNIAAQGKVPANTSLYQLSPVKQLNGLYIVVVTDEWQNVLAKTSVILTFNN